MNNTQPLVSVIVPIYNVEKYLAKCLDSLINQTLKNIEIICIDDCSTDNSVNIATSFKEKDNRICIISHSQNKGLAAARNTGLKNAKAQYIMCCDSDDFYSLDMCKKLYDGIIKSGADFATSGINIVYEAMHEYKTSDDLYYSVKYNGLVPLTNDMLSRIDVSSCNKIFRRELIEKYNILYPEGFCYEDACFFFKYFSISTSAFFINEKLYNYVRRSNSIMDKTFKGSLKALDHLEIMEDVYSFFLKHNLLSQNTFSFFSLYMDYYNFANRHLPKTKKYLAKNCAIKFVDNELKNCIKYLSQAEIEKIQSFIRKIKNTKKIKLFKTKKKNSKRIFCFLGIPLLKIKKQKILLFAFFPIINLDFFFAFLSYIFNFFPVKKNRVIFYSMFGQGYGDNPKYIAKEMLKRTRFELVWFYDKNKLHYVSEFPKEIKLVDVNSIKALYYLATYNFFISNVRQNLLSKNGLKKKKSQVYIHTWHGNFPFKKIEADYPKLPKNYVEMAKKDSLQIDYLCSGSTWSENRLFKECFWYNGKYFRGGNPRNDILFNTSSNIIQKIYSYFQIKENQKVLLYAPTFRDNYSPDVYKIDYLNLKKTVEKKFGGDWTILSRLHPNMVNEKNILPNYDWLVDATHYPDMQELLSVADVLITDYSSSIFDFLNTQRPAFIFAPDKDYYEKERGFVIPMEETPFSVSLTNEELAQNIDKFDFEEFSKNAIEFLKFRGSYDNGCASKKLVDFIIKGMKYD